jgi:nicotinamide-nucleotide amidase
MASEKILTCSKLLAENGLSIAFAESATAGWLCSEFALAPESGKVLMGGIVCYDASLKESILGISADLIKQFTPESQEVTEELARRLPRLIPADICVGVTGLTTAGGSETEEKPVGTMFISVFKGGEIVNFRKVFSGKCEEIIQQTVDAVATLLVEQVKIRDANNTVGK